MNGRHDRRELERARTSAEARRRLVRDDESRLFSLLALDEIPSARLDELADRLETALDDLEVSTAPAPLPLRPRVQRWAVGALAASMLGIAALGWFLVEGRAKKSGAVAQVDRPSVESVPLEIPVLPASAAATGVHLLDSPGDARVVDVAVGEVRVVMIFDEALDL